MQSQMHNQTSAGPLCWPCWGNTTPWGYGGPGNAELPQGMWAECHAAHLHGTAQEFSVCREVAGPQARFGWSLQRTAGPHGM